MRNKRREQQGLHQPVVVQERRRQFGRLGQVMLVEKGWSKPGEVDLAGLIERRAHRIRERVVAVGDDVVQVADRNQLANFEHIPPCNE